RDGEHCMFLVGRHAFQAAHIGKFGVSDDDADGLGSVHGGTAADGDDAVCFGGLESGYAVLHMLDGGVGFDVAVEGISKVCCIQQIGDFFGDTELDQVGIRADKGFLVAAGGQLGDDVFNGAVAMIGNGVQNN